MELVGDLAKAKEKKALELAEAELVALERLIDPIFNISFIDLEHLSYHLSFIYTRFFTPVSPQ